MALNKDKLHVCWLKDSRLGHLTKIEGVLKALRLHYVVDIEEVDVRWKPRFLRRCASLLPSSYYRKTLTPKPSDSAGLIISAGGATEWPNAKLAKSLGVPNLYIGSCRTCSEEDFTVLPRFEGNAKSVLRLNISPSKVDPDFAKRVADAELPEYTATYWTVLLGGSCNGCAWGVRDWKEQLNRLLFEAHKAQVSLLVSSSPRTGRESEKICERILQESGMLAKAVWYGAKEANQPSLIALLGKAERILVTEDSASMVNEAVLAGKPVATIAPSKIQLPARNERMLATLEKCAYIRRLRGADWEFASLDPSQWKTVSSKWYYDFGEQLRDRIEHWSNSHEI